jgi:hypothetical protein
VCIRIQRSRATVKDLHSRLHHAYQRDDVRLVRRRTVWLDLLGHQVPMAGLCERWGLRFACRYDWQQALLRRGRDSLVYGHGGGRRPPLTPRQKQRVVARLEAGPLAVGCETACGPSVLLRVLSWRECGVLDHRPYGGTRLPNLGFSCHKARLVSAPLDTAKRLAWREDTWPAMVRAATRTNGWIRFEDEARCAPWGSLSSPWARRGQPPAVPPSGKRKGDTVFGAMAYVSGRLFSQGIEGRFHSESSHTVLQRSLEHTQEHGFVLHDGAR